MACACEPLPRNAFISRSPSHTVIVQNVRCASTKSLPPWNPGVRTTCRCIATVSLRNSRRCFQDRTRRRVTDTSMIAILKCLLPCRNFESFGVDLPGISAAGMSCELKFERLLRLRHSFEGLQWNLEDLLACGAFRYCRSCGEPLRNSQTRSRHSLSLPRSNAITKRRQLASSVLASTRPEHLVASNGVAERSSKKDV